MKPLVSGVIGALAAGLMVSAWHGRTSAEQELTIARPAPSAVHLASQDADTVSDQNAAFSPVNVQCAPGQRAIVRQVPTTQGLTTDVQCVSAPGDEMLVWNGYAAPAPRVVPAVYSAPAPQQVVAERTVRRTTDVRVNGLRLMTVISSAMMISFALVDAQPPE